MQLLVGPMTFLVKIKPGLKRYTKICSRSFNACAVFCLEMHSFIPEEEDYGALESPHIFD